MKLTYVLSDLFHGPCSFGLLSQQNGGCLLFLKALVERGAVIPGLIGEDSKRIESNVSCPDFSDFSLSSRPVNVSFLRYYLCPTAVRIYPNVPQCSRDLLFLLRLQFLSSLEAPTIQCKLWKEALSSEDSRQGVRVQGFGGLGIGCVLSCLVYAARACKQARVGA